MSLYGGDLDLCISLALRPENSAQDSQPFIKLLERWTWLRDYWMDISAFYQVLGTQPLFRIPVTLCSQRDKHHFGQSRDGSEFPSFVCSHFPQHCCVHAARQCLCSWKWLCEQCQLLWLPKRLTSCGKRYQPIGVSFLSDHHVYVCVRDMSSDATKLAAAKVVVVQKAVKRSGVLSVSMQWSKY